MSNIYIQEPPSNGKVLLKTSVGDIDIELWSKEAPKACRNFVQLCLEGYYDGTTFHRVVKDFIVQGGDPTDSGEGGESVYGAPFKDEFHSRLRFVRRGLVAMANAGPHDNGSQFFFTMAATPELQNKHTIFGKVVGDTLYNMLKLQEVEVDEASERPVEPHRILSTEVLSNPFDDIVPRQNKRVKKDKDDEKKIKSKSKATKNFSLLSFGDEAEDDEEQVDKATESFRGKSKSSHDLTDDPRLSSVPALEKERLDEDKRSKKKTEGSPDDEKAAKKREDGGEEWEETARDVIKKEPITEEEAGAKKKADSSPEESKKRKSSSPDDVKKRKSDSSPQEETSSRKRKSDSSPQQEDSAKKWRKSDGKEEEGKKKKRFSEQADNSSEVKKSPEVTVVSAPSKTNPGLEESEVKKKKVDAGDDDVGCSRKSTKEEVKEESRGGKRKPEQMEASSTQPQDGKKKKSSEDWYKDDRKRRSKEGEEEERKKRKGDSKEEDGKKRRKGEDTKEDVKKKVKVEAAEDDPKDKDPKDLKESKDDSRQKVKKDKEESSRGKDSKLSLLGYNEDDKLSRMEELKKEQRRLQRDIKDFTKKRSAADERAKVKDKPDDAENAEEKKDNEPEDSDLLAMVKKERQKYKSRKKQLGRGGDREAATMAMLARFQNKLTAARTLAGNYDDVEDEKVEEEEGEDDSSDMSWLCHKLHFEEEGPKTKVIDVNISDSDRYALNDPRNPLNQRRRESSKRAMRDKR